MISDKENYKKLLSACIDLLSIAECSAFPYETPYLDNAIALIQRVHSGSISNTEKSLANWSGHYPEEE